MTNEIEEHDDGWAATLDRLNPFIYLAVVLVAAVTITVLGGFLVHQQHQIKRTARIAADTARLAAANARATQHNRIEVIRSNCEDQNTRHDDAVLALYTLLQKSGVKASRRAASAAPIINLIDALAPHQDCDKVVAAATPKPAKPQKGH